jgi:carbamoyl-phosphate synthase large subunit
VRRPELIAYGLELGKKAAVPGPCDIDVIDRDGRLFLIEFNMRFGGGYPVSQLADARFLEKLVRVRRGERPALHTGFAGDIFMMKTLQPFGGRLDEAGRTFRMEDFTRHTTKHPMLTGSNG